MTKAGRLGEVLQRIELLKAELAQLQTEATGLFPQVAAEFGVEQKRVISIPANRGRRPRDGKKSERQRMVDAIKKLGKPVKVADLVEYFGSHPPEVPEKNLRSYVGKASRAGQIIALGDGDYAPLGYTPTKEGNQ